jgi:hypothetical protein
MELYVWIYDLAERRCRRRAPKNVAALRHYYAYRDKDEQLINVIEPHLERVLHFSLQVLDWGYGTQSLPQRYQ